MPYVVTPDEIPIYYIDEGPRSSAGIFLIPAEPFNSKFWQKNIPELSQRFRVVAMDVRGRGESGKTDDGHNLTQFARDFRQVLEELGLEKVLVVGWSLGGSIVWSYMEQFGDDRLAGYVNVDQRPARIVPEGFHETMLEAVRTHPIQYYSKSVRWMLGPDMALEEEVFNWMVYECMKTPTSTHCTTVTEAYHSDWRPFLPSVRIPTRVFWAKHGGIRSEMAQDMVQAMPNSRLVYFEKSGHLLPWTEAEKFNQEVEAFAREVL